MKCLAIEGLDGSGKSTVAQALKKAYEAEGLAAGVVAPYRLAAKANGGDLYPLWSNEFQSLDAVRMLKRVISNATRNAEEAGLDILIFDRHWMTAFTEILQRPRVVEEWGDEFVPTAFLKVDPKTALQRASGDQFEAWMTPEGLQSYSERYSQLCKQYGRHLLGIYRNDDDTPVDAIVRNVIWDMNIRR